MLRIALYDSETHATPLAVDIDWSDLQGLLTEITPTECSPCPGKTCTAKKGEAWSPVDIVDRRANANVRAVTVAVFDLDHLTEAQIQDLAPTLAPYQWVMHSTHSHAPPADNCLRLVMALTRPVPAKDWARFLRNTIGLLKIPADPICKDLSRLYFLPRAPRGNPTSVDVNDGKPLDVDAILALTIATNGPIPSEISPDPVPVNIAELRVAIRAAARSKRASRDKDPERVKRSIAVGDLLWHLSYGKPFCVSGDHTGPTELPRGRDAALNDCLSALTAAIPTDTPWEVIAELLRPCMAPVAAPEGIAYWLEEGKDQWERAVERRIEYLRERSEADRRVKEAFERSSLARPKALEIGEPVPEDLEPIPGNDDGEWTAGLIVSKDGYRSCAHNVGLILEHAEGIGGCLCWNDVTREIIVRGGFFKDTPIQTLATVVTGWLQRKWGIYVQTSVTKEWILSVARKNTVDPLKEYLEGLTWDGVGRIDTWLEDFCHARTVNADGEDISKWIRTISARWCIAAVARALMPGCKVDNVLILEGVQNLGKSSLFKALGGEWFVDDKINIGDKDSKMLAAQTWICELGELASLQRGETDTQKAFFTQAWDKFRPPYGAVMETFPRRCIFVGTVNPDECERGYLKDRTGNRRYWPVYCESSIDVAGVRAVRDQLFAEAVYRYRAGEKWWLDQIESEGFERSVTADRVEGDSETLLAAIRFWWSKTLQNRPAEVSMHTVAVAVGMDPARMSKADETKLGRALRTLKFDHRRRMRNGVREYFYVGPPEGFDTTPTKPNLLHSVATAKVKEPN